MTSFKAVCESTLTCGHSITFGNCGAAGDIGQMTHQKDPQIVAAYDDFFRRAYPSFSPRRILEIGVCRGGSLAIWREWFKNVIDIVGVDNDLGQVRPWTLDHYKEDGRIQVHHLTMPNPEIRKFGMFDLIIDDGGHGPKAVFPTFDLCWSMLNPGGIYLVEDWHQDFLEPKVQITHFVEKMIGHWPEPMPRPEVPYRLTAYRAFYAMEKI